MGLDNAYGIGSLKPGVCTSTTRPSSPYDGQMIYETDTNRVAVYDTNAWVYKTFSSTAGSLLQVVSTAKTDTFSTTSTSYTDITGLSVSITPSSTSSKVFVVFETRIGASSDAFFVQVLRDTTAIYRGDAAGSRTRATAGGNYLNQYISGTSTGMYLDSPSSTSALTYKLQMKVSAGTGYVNRGANDTDNAAFDRTASSITVMEIAG